MRKISVRIVTTAAGAGEAWWNNQSKEQKAAYIKAHPNSKYAKQAGAEKETVVNQHPKKLITDSKLNKKQEKIKELNVQLKNEKETLKKLTKQLPKYRWGSSASLCRSEIADIKEKIQKIEKQLQKYEDKI
jgi:septal ring factor EnvC (AmiA/AmiB activator)